MIIRLAAMSDAASGAACHLAAGRRRTPTS